VSKKIIYNITNSFHYNIMIVKDQTNCIKKKVGILTNFQGFFLIAKSIEAPAIAIAIIIAIAAAMT